MTRDAHSTSSSGADPALLAARARALELEQQVEHLNRELAETNRGVMALYAELDDRAESLRRASEAKTRFLSGMTHEFRSPLNSILNLSRMLATHLDGPLNSEQQKQVSYIQRAGSELLDLVNDLLDIAKAEAGKITLRPLDFTVAGLFGTLRGTTRPLLSPTRDVALVFEDPPPDLLLYTDESKLTQVLRNLISNAIKFTQAGSIRVSAELTGDEMIRFIVADTGVGIPADEIERIFEEFAQVDNPLQKESKGTGLGLPLARQLARLLGGDITVESTPGVGSVFTVVIQMRLTEAPAATRPAGILDSPI